MRTNDPLWDEYREAVAGLQRLPVLLADRDDAINASRDAAVATAKIKRDARLRQGEQYRMQAARALSNAQARLVATGVLIPDVSSGTPTDSNEVGVLAAQLGQAVSDFDRDTARVSSARRRAEDERALQAVAQARAAARRQRLRWAAIGAAGVVVLVLMLWLL